MDRLFKVQDAAATLSVSAEHLKRLHRAGHLKVVRIGLRGIRIPESEIVRLSREGVGVAHGAAK